MLRSLAWLPGTGNAPECGDARRTYLVQSQDSTPQTVEADEYKWQATWWPASLTCNTGSTSEQTGMAAGQRGWKRQPDGRARALGRGFGVGREGAGFGEVAERQGIRLIDTRTLSRAW